MPTLIWLSAFACIMCLVLGCNSSRTLSQATEHPTVEAANESITNWAVQLIKEYLDSKPWGFFGASCEQWLEIDYLTDTPTATVEMDGRIHVAFQRHPDRTLGPGEVKYYVDLSSADVVGDHGSGDERLGTTEGCDRW